MNLKLLLTKTLLVAAGLCAGANGAWGTDPDLENDYTLVKSITWGGASPTALVAGSAVSGLTAYETGNAKQQALVAVTAPSEAAGWIAFQAIKTDFSDNNNKGWWNRENQGLWTFGAPRSGAVYGDDLTTGWLVVFTCSQDAANVMTLTNASSEPDGQFTYEKSTDTRKYYCTVNAASDAHVGFCGKSSIGYITSIAVYRPKNAVTTYTVRYQDALGNTLKTSVDYPIVEGNTYTASASDMASFYSNDYSKVYNYNSGNTSATAVTNAASNVVTLVFDVTDNTQYTHTINATGNVSKTDIASLTLYTGQTGILYYSKYIQDGGKWYSTLTNGNSGSAISYGVSVSASGSTNKSYSSSSITDFIEVEDMNRNHSWASEGTASRASNGKAPRLYNGSYAFTNVITEGGVYDVTVGGRGYTNASDDLIDLYYGTYVSATEAKDLVFLGTFEAWAYGGIAEKTLRVLVPAGKVLVIKNPQSDGVCKAEADYLYITKTSDVTTLASSGWSSYSSAYALDFANATDPSSEKTLKAYVISALSSTSATLTEVTSAPAETGVILKGTASTAYSIPVTASPSVAGTNKLTAAVNGATVSARSTYVVSDGQLKLFTGTAIPANKAYLDASLLDGLAPSFIFEFEGGTTGINTVEQPKGDFLNGEFYNLNGQRVVQPTKGLYIVGGKKVIVK